MTLVAERFLPECIGNVRVEFFTAFGSFALEAWRGTRDCRVKTYSGGFGHSVRLRLNDDQWSDLMLPLSISGFWHWEKRYDGPGTYCPMIWRSSIMTDHGWFCSSGDGDCPEGLWNMLKELTRFTASLENRRSESASVFLSPVFREETA